MLNQLIERLVEEGYLTLLKNNGARRDLMGGMARGESKSRSAPMSNSKLLRKAWILGYKLLRNRWKFGQEFMGASRYVASRDGVEAEAASKAL